MKKYLTKQERENLASLLSTTNPENVRLGISLLENSPMYKYSKNKIIYRSWASKYPKITVLQLVKVCKWRLNLDNIVPIASDLIAKKLLKYEKVF